MRQTLFTQVKLGVNVYIKLYFAECEDQFWCKYLVDLPKDCTKENEMEGCPTKCIEYLPKYHKCFKEQGDILRKNYKY